MTLDNNIIQWCIDQHRNTNHYYDKYIPYEFHLRMVREVYNDFKYILPSFLFEKIDDTRLVTRIDLTHIVIESSCWGHDLIEDTRTSYNDVKDVLGKDAADIIYAVSNEKGKNRKERANDQYYSGIRNTKGAVFVKLCDRIANVQYSKLTKSRMYEMYKKENPEFILNIWVEKTDLNPINYQPMIEYLNKLFD